MSKNRQSRVTKSSQLKGRAVSFVLHAALFLLAFLPFLSMQLPEAPSKEALVIQFDFPYNEYVAPEKFVVENMNQGSSSSGSEEGGSTPSQEPQQTRPTEAAPSRLQAPAMSSPVRSTSMLSSSTSDIPLPQPKIVTHQAWSAVSDEGGVENDGVEELKMIEWSDGSKGQIAASGEGDDDSDVFNDGFGSGTGGSGNGTGGGPGNGNGPGSGPGGGTGTGGLGKGSGIGGTAIGDGDLSRSLIQRSPKAGALAVKEGKICIYLCVDKNGKVISSSYNLAKSTIKDISLLTKAQETAKEYVFAPDIMASEKQCGNFYFVFSFN
ncbi:MAG: hypothetical protein M3R25_02380 [Bacteroidota bacterium]|nr:hypothetical protein [Bacteroidota bacterium]